LSKREAELRQSMLSCAPEALVRTKQHLRQLTAAHLFDQLNEGMLVSALARETEAASEGLAAFLEKRPPRWTPKA
jgi:enoyl-CoA hydratase/carnithine racemase